MIAKTLILLTINSEMKQNQIPLNLYCDMNLQRSLFSPECNTDKTILFIEGSSDQVLAKIHQIIASDALPEYQSLRIKIKGNVIKKQDTCCIFTTILAASMILLPIFCIVTDCWKRKAYKIVQIQEEVYIAISRLLKVGQFTQFFLQMEDSIFNEKKVDYLYEGVKSRVRNLYINNSAKNFNANQQNNSSKFNKFIKPLLDVVDSGQCRWERDIKTNKKSSRVSL